MSEWLTKALVAMLFLIPAFIATPVLQRNFGVRPEAALVWWCLGVLVGVSGWVFLKGESEILSPVTPTWFMGCLGLVVGATANISLFQSLAKAPNPGLTVAIVNTNAAITYLIVVLLAFLLPRYFESIQLSWQHLIGILLVTIGIALISIKQ